MPRSRNTGCSATPDFFAWLETNWRDVFAGGPAREHAIAVCCRAKAAIVARDERETGDRALLNLGHTFGHAFEAGAGYSQRLLHGEAVALGMRAGLRVFRSVRAWSAATAWRACARILPRPACRPSRAMSHGGVPDADRLMDLIAQDKKVKRGKLTFILARGIGEAFVADDVDPAAVRAFLQERIEEKTCVTE